MAHISLVLQQTYTEPASDPTAGYVPSSGQSMWQHMGVALHDSMYRMLSFFSRLLPSLLALILAIAILTAIGALLAFVLKRILVALKFDERAGEEPVGGHHFVDSGLGSVSQPHRAGGENGVLVVRGAGMRCGYLGL